MDRSYEMMMGFVHPQWNLLVGADVPILATINDQEFHVKGTVLTPHQVTVPLNQSLRINHWLNARTFKAKANGYDFTFDVENIALAVGGLPHCVARELASEGQGSAKAQPVPFAEPTRR